jgi:hypothetical protein
MSGFIPEHQRLQDCLQDLARKGRPVGRPPFRPWRHLEIGQAVLMEAQAAAKAGVAWAKRHGRIFTREKQKDGTGWLVRRKA